jgi:hypothetical protein
MLDELVIANKDGTGYLSSQAAAPTSSSGRCRHVWNPAAGSNILGALRGIEALMCPTNPSAGGRTFDIGTGVRCPAREVLDAFANLVGSRVERQICLSAAPRSRSGE